MNTQFKRWTDAEEGQLMKEVSEGLPIYAIAKAHARSKKAIEIRLLDISIRLINNGISYDEVKEKTGMTEEQIKQRIIDIDAEKTPKKSEPIPFRQIEIPDNPLLSTILDEIKGLKMMIANTMSIDK